MAPVHDAAERGDIEALAAMAREDHGLLRLRDPFDRTPLLWVRKEEGGCLGWSRSTAARARVGQHHQIPITLD